MPSARFVYLLADAQEPWRPPSMRHAKWTPPSWLENEKVAEFTGLVASGRCRMNVFGGVLSITHI